MNKLSVIGLPLPITSAFLVYSFGFSSSVEARETSVLNQKSFDFSSQLFLAEARLSVGLFPLYESSLNFNLQSHSFTRNNISLPIFSNSNYEPKLASIFRTATNVESITIPLIPETIPTVELKTLSSTDNITKSKSNSQSDRINLEYFRVKADRSTPITWRDRQNKSTKSILKNQPINLVSNIPHNTNYSKSDRHNIISSELVNFADKSNTSSISIDNSINQTLNQIQQHKLPGLGVESLTKVSSLKDVEPTDWAYRILVTMNEQYGCLNSFGDNTTFKGTRSVTRYEFAAGLSSCFQALETIASDDSPSIAELTKINRLQAEFEAELLTVQTAIDNLEQKVTFLENHNFSTTSILRGQVDFIVASAFGGNKVVPSGETITEDLEDEVTFSSRARLNFETSFTGRDLLRTRIEAGNINAFGSGVTGTQMTFLGAGTNTGNNVRLGQIFYRFPLGDKGNAYIAGARQSASAFIPTLNRASTISLFGFNNPLYDLGFGAGGGAYYQFSDLIGVGATYYSGSPNSPEENKGFFNGDYSALGQVTFTPSDSLGVSFTYAHFFSPQPGATNNVTSFTGSQFAQIPFGENTATASDNFNLAFAYQISDRLELGGWLGYINATAKSSPTDSGFLDLSDANADIWTGAITASYNDLGKLGSKLSFILGVPPKLTSNDLSNRQDNDTSLHLELSYSYPLTERISLKPGVLAITNPEHNSENDSIAIGLLQTTLSF